MISQATISPQVLLWPIEQFVFYARNPRKNDAAVDRMCSSIREFGFKIPVLARSDGTVVDGHLRLKSARKLGSWPGGDTTGIPVILCDEWTEAQVKAFRLMVNRSVTWADWDEELLALELQELNEADFDLSLTGFDDEELARVLAAEEATEGLTDEDAAPDVPKVPASVVGDRWHNVDYEGYPEDRLATGLSRSRASRCSTEFMVPYAYPCAKR
jgi:ParB-like chromosome segregation protein Spo0J